MLRAHRAPSVAMPEAPALVFQAVRVDMMHISRGHQTRPAVGLVRGPHENAHVPLALDALLHILVAMSSSIGRCHVFPSLLRDIGA
eukprot:7742074-Pyramimonas_sp.AAC.1